MNNSYEMDVIDAAEKRASEKREAKAEARREKEHTHYCIKGERVINRETKTFYWSGKVWYNEGNTHFFPRYWKTRQAAENKMNRMIQNDEEFGYQLSVEKQWV